MRFESVGKTRVGEDRVKRKNNKVVDQNGPVNGDSAQSHRERQGEEEERREDEAEDDDERVDGIQVLVVKDVAAWGMGRKGGEVKICLSK